MRFKVLLVGESWTTSETHYKGFDQFGSVRFMSGAKPLLDALKGSEFQVDYMTSHDAAEGFPFEIGGLSGYDVIILSDIGANTFLLPPERASQETPGARGTAPGVCGLHPCEA